MLSFCLSTFGFVFSNGKAPLLGWDQTVNEKHPISLHLENHVFHLHFSNCLFWLIIHPHCDGLSYWFWLNVSRVKMYTLHPATSVNSHTNSEHLWWCHLQSSMPMSQHVSNTRGALHHSFSIHFSSIILIQFYHGAICPKHLKSRTQEDCFHVFWPSLPTFLFLNVQVFTLI